MLSHAECNAVWLSRSRVVVQQAPASKSNMAIATSPSLRWQAIRRGVVTTVNARQHISCTNTPQDVQCRIPQTFLACPVQCRVVVTISCCDATGQHIQVQHGHRNIDKFTFVGHQKRCVAFNISNRQRSSCSFTLQKPQRHIPQHVRTRQVQSCLAVIVSSVASTGLARHRFPVQHGHCNTVLPRFTRQKQRCIAVRGHCTASNSCTGLVQQVTYHVPVPLLTCHMQSCVANAVCAARFHVQPWSGLCHADCRRCTCGPVRVLSTCTCLRQ